MAAISCSSVMPAVVGFRLGAAASAARICLIVQPSMMWTDSSCSSPTTIFWSSERGVAPGVIR